MGLAVAAFVSSKPLCKSPLATTAASLAARGLPQRRPHSALFMAGLADYSGAASGFFTSVRIPAALIAGSSLAAVFTLVNESRDEQVENRTVIKSLFLLIYHVLAYVSLLLSLNVIFMSTATANTLLLGVQNPMASSAYALLEREFYYEFLLTRWSFYNALFAFLGCIAARSLLEFGLLTKRRIRSAMLVVFPVLSLGFHLLSIVNSRPPTLPAMTTELLHRYFIRCLTGKKTICELASVASFFGAVFSGITVFRMNRIRLFSQSKPGQSNADFVDEDEESSNELEVEIGELDASMDDSASLGPSTAIESPVESLEASTATDIPEQ